MGEFINKYSIKIQFGMAIIVIGTIISTTLYIGGYFNQIELNENAIASQKNEIIKIPILENDLSNMKENIGEIKDDVKELLKK